MVSLGQQIYRYRLNEKDVIESVDDRWLAFARENGACRLNRASVVGRPIWDFIADDPTRALYGEIHQYVRCTGKSTVVPFRCDSPTLKRYMELTISKFDGQLQYESKLTRVAAHRRMSMYDPTKERSSESLTMCSMCKRSLIEPAGWQEMEDISLRLRLHDQETVPDLNYTVCPHCTGRFNKISSGSLH